MTNQQEPANGMAAITHVSDTALWVASIRAIENRRKDAIFADPLADILAGPRGHAIERAIPRRKMTAWGMILRTSAIDRLIYEALHTGVETVLNLGAGMDTRPYRMNLEKSLRWVEIDFAQVIDLKNAALATHQPICRLERIALDLTDRASRRCVLARYLAASNSTLVITEGVLSYWSVHDVSTLAADLHEEPSIHCWIQDFDNAGQRTMPRGWAKSLKAAPCQFEVKNWFDFFECYGWHASKIIASFEESRRINRPYPLDFPYGLMMRAIPKEWQRKILSLSGVALMKKAPCIQSVHATSSNLRRRRLRIADGGA